MSHKRFMQFKTETKKQPKPISLTHRNKNKRNEVRDPTILDQKKRKTKKN